MSSNQDSSMTTNTVPPTTTESGFSMNLAYWPKDGNERNQDLPSAPNGKQSGFFENLSFRPRPAGKRKRDLSPRSNDSNTAASLGNRSFPNPLRPASQPNQDDTEHDEKRRRGNYPPDGMSSEELLELFGELTPEAAAASHADMALALESVQLKETTGKRAARRQREASQPFVPKQGPVFGLASLMGPDEQNLVLAQRRPTTKFVPYVLEHPAENLPRPEPRVTRARAKESVVQKFCVCRSTSDETMVQCRFCQKHFHPACVGKGLHGEDGHQGDRQHAARLSDATYYREKGGFTCPDCDERWFTKQRWTTRKYKAEEQRRGKLFSAKDWLGVDGRPKKCSNCKDQINSKRYECIYCEHFDLCRKCFSDPYISSKHEHEEGDMVLRPRK